MPDPKLLLVDEPSFGLAPNLTDGVFAALTRLNNDGSDHPGGGAECNQNPQIYLPGLRPGKRKHRTGRGPAANWPTTPHVRKVFLGV